MAPPRHRASFADWVAKRRPTGLRARHTYDLDRSITNAPTAAGHLSGWDYQHRPGPSPCAASSGSPRTTGARSRTRPSAAGRCGGRRRRRRRRRVRRAGGGAAAERALQEPLGRRAGAGCVYVAGRAPALRPRVLGRAGPAAAATFRSGTRRGPSARCRARAARGARAGAPRTTGSGAAGRVGSPRRGRSPARRRSLRDAAHAPFLRPRPPKPRPSTAPALVAPSRASGRPRAGAPRGRRAASRATASRGP